MGLVTQKLHLTPNALGILDGRGPSGAPTTPTLTWAPVPSYLQKLQGTPFSVDISVYLTSTSGDAITFSLQSGTWPSGWSISSAGVISYDGSAIGDAVVSITATQDSTSATSNTFTVESIAVASSDTLAPTIPTGLNAPTVTSSAITVTCDAPCDPSASATAPYTGMAQVNFYKGGVLDGHTTTSPGLSLRLAVTDIIGSVGTVSTRKLVTGHYIACGNSDIAGSSFGNAGPFVKSSTDGTSGTLVTTGAVIRHQWSDLEPGTTSLTAVTGGSATSATLSSAWAYASGTYTMLFTEQLGGANEVRTATLTNGSTAVSWSPALTNPCTSVVGVYDLSTITSDLALCQAKGVMYFPMVIVKTFSTNTTVAFTATVRGQTSGTLTSGTQLAAGQYGCVFLTTISGGTAAGESRLITVASNGTSVTWTGALNSTTAGTGTILGAYTNPVSNNPLPAYLNQYADIFASVTGGWEGWRWNATVLARFQPLVHAIGATFDSNAFFGGIATQETAPGQFTADQNTRAGYTLANFMAALKAENAYISAGCPTSRHLWYFNFADGGTNPQVTAALEDVAATIQPNGTIIGGPDLVVGGSVTTRCYPIYSDYHFGTHSSGPTAMPGVGYTFCSIQHAELVSLPGTTGITPANQPCASLQDRFNYGTGVKQVYGSGSAITPPLNLDIIVTNYAGGASPWSTWVGIMKANPTFGTIKPT